MNCLKCGTVIPEGACFCDQCLAGMKDYPVPPDAVVQLPVRPAESAKRGGGRRRVKLSDEDMIRLLRKRLRRSYAAVAILILLQCVLIATTVGYVRSHRGPQPGQNYSTVITSGQSAGK